MESEAHAFDSQEQENTDILMSSPVSTPTNVANRVSIKFDKTTGVFSGVPPQILEKLQQQGYSLEDVEKDPLLIKDFLYEQNLEETLKPTKPPADSKNPLFQRTKYIFDFAMESWYHILEDCTPKTEFVSLSIPQAMALYDLCHYYYSGTKQDQLDSNKQNVLANIETEIDKKIQGFGGKAFVKLSTRSPKDAYTSTVNQKMTDIYLQELKKSDGTPNGDLCAFSNAGRLVSVVHSGKEALEILQRSSRIREDLMRALEFPSAFTLDIIVREWIPMLPQQEFRAFVFNSQMTAISQYCYYQYYPEVAKNAQKLKDRMLSFWKTIADKVPQKNYIIDFVVLDDRVLIIELNPWFQDTSACIFSWREPADREILHNGPFQIRVLEKPLEDPYSALALEWRSFTEKHRGIEPKRKQKPGEQEVTEFPWGIAVGAVVAVGLCAVAWWKKDELFK